MNIVGIDFSVNNPAACLAFSGFQNFHWFAVKNDKPTKRLRSIIEESDGFSCAFIESKIPKGPKGETPYHIIERNKLRNQLDVVEALMSQVELALSSTGMDAVETIYALEGYSYGSSGNSLIDIVQATGILKERISKYALGGNLDRFFIFSPGELKNAIKCKGNAGKEDVFKAFLEDPMIPNIKETRFWKFLERNRDEIFKNGTKVEEPFMGMVDSYLSVLKIYRQINNTH